MADAFDCRRCGAHFTPAHGQWIFHGLCSACFVLFDDQKWRGRNACIATFMSRDALASAIVAGILPVTSGVTSTPELPYFEDSRAWITAELDGMKILPGKAPS